MPFPRGNRDVDRLGHPRNRLHVLWGDRILVEQQTEILQGVAQSDRVPRGHPRRPVHVYHQIHLHPHLFADRLHRLDAVFDAAGLECREAPIYQLPRPLRLVRVGVELHPVPHLAAQQLVYRHPQRLPLDIPQRHIDRRDRPRQQPRRRPATQPRQPLANRLRVHRIATDRHLAQPVDRRL